MNYSSKLGFSIIELVIVVAVVGLGGFLGYTYFAKQKAQVADTASSQARTADVPAAPAVNTAADLTTAEKALDSITVGSTSDSSQLDAELVNF